MLNLIDVANTVRKYFKEDYPNMTIHSSRTTEDTEYSTVVETLHLYFVHKGNSYRVKEYYTYYTERNHTTSAIEIMMTSSFIRKIKNVLSGISPGLPPINFKLNILLLCLT